MSLRSAPSAVASALIALATTVVPAAGAAQAAASASERVTLAGQRVEIYNLVGSVRIVRGSGRDVVAVVTRAGRDAGQLRVEHGGSGEGQSLRVIFPSSHITYTEMEGRSRTTVHVDDDGTFHAGGERSGRRVEISDRAGGLDARADVTLEVPVGKRVAVNLGAGAVTATNVEAELSIDVAAATVTTSGTKGTLSLDTGSGAVSVTDQTGDLTIDAGSGSVTLARVRGGRVVVDGGSGRIRGEDVQAESLDLDLGSGGARVMRLAASDVRLDAGSGSTELDLLGDIRTLDIDSGSGSVTIWVPASLGARVDIDAGSGGIDMDMPVQVTRWERDRVVGTIGDGEGTIRIDAGSGAIRLKKRTP